MNEKKIKYKVFPTNQYKNDLKLAEKGDEQAKKEYQEWQIVETLVSDENYVEVNYSALKADGK